ncbi:MAG: RnfH family protein [Betaproteobacteria bacterium RIFCSPLOWO2_12_FULL_63_13]|nr:MAG: RnfH family protein [Betaproteobacteria bacterium RIFCSPLOWO2_02_FULL_63_19]OGA49434.1 MAG: RnfH family protein [Betaproteobacteria bacterium RIFCSPLOWO2_12_FULL_63_13]
MHIEVVYGAPVTPVRCRLNLPMGSTVGDAVRACGLLEQYPEINLNRNRVGIFGRLVSQAAPLRDGDRVEIYRPLQADPKEARRRRAASARKRAMA